MFVPGVLYACKEKESNNWNRLIETNCKAKQTSSFDADTICDVTTLFRFELACNSHERQQYLLIVP